MVAVPFNNLITFSRGSNATVTGSNGLIQYAPNNLLTFSEQFDNANWSKQDLTATPNALSAPDGTTTADRILETATNVLHQVYVAYNFFTVGLTYTWSIYAKAQGRDWFWLEAHDGGNRKTWFNLVSGTVGTNAAGNTATITPVGDGWYRVSLSRVAAGTNGYFAFGPANADGSSVYPGDITRGVNVWGAQLELGSTATTYNPTTVKNLLGFSEAFSDASWTKVAASIVPGAQANPINGLFNAQKFMEGTANAQYAVFRSVAVGAAPHTFSMYAKLAPGTPRFFCLYPQGAGVAWAIFDLALGTTTAVSAINYISSSITPVGSGWYRCSITLNTTASNLFCNAYLTNSSGTPAPSYTGDGNSGVYIYGAQLSDSASLDPYVPTPGAAPSSTAFYGPRFDFDPVTLQPRGLLVEEQRTNLLLYSERFDIGGGSWPLANVSVTPNSTTAPDGTLTADTITVTSTGSFRYINQNVTLTNGATYTLTVYLKYKTARYVWLLGETSTDAFAIFDLLTGTVGSATAGVTRSITPVGSGWYRCSATFTVSSATAPQQVGFGFSDTDTVIIPVATAGIDTFAWGAQLEAGAFATSYIPTVASTVTRSADVATISGQNFAQWYRQDEGCLVAEAAIATADNVGNRFVAQTDAGTDATRMLLVFDPTTQAVADVSSVRQASLDGGTPNIGPANRLAFAYRVNDFGLSLNGGAAATDTSGSIPTTNVFRIGIGASGTVSVLSGHIRNIRFIPARAADFQLQALST